MSFKTRFILLALINCGVMVGFFYVFSQFGLEASKRLIDLDLENPSDKIAFFTIVLTMLVAFLGNFIVLIIRKTEFGKKDIEEIVHLLRSQDIQIKKMV